MRKQASCQLAHAWGGTLVESSSQPCQVCQARSAHRIPGRHSPTKNAAAAHCGEHIDHGLARGSFGGWWLGQAAVALQVLQRGQVAVNLAGGGQGCRAEPKGMPCVGITAGHNVRLACRSFGMHGAVNEGARAAGRRPQSMPVNPLTCGQAVLRNRRLVCRAADAGSSAGPGHQLQQGSVNVAGG